NIGAEKFFDEAELVRRFNGNPNIISIYECFYKNNTAYYVMEYLDGITLENYVRGYGALNSSQALYIADKLTMALVVLHSGEVLHRDISPDNVMLCRDGSVKLIDFGAARQFLAEGKAGYTVIMKTGFSPAEQYSQSSDTDIRADIYSTGTLLYYTLTGSVPESPYKRMENDSAFAGNPADADSGLWSVIEKAAAVSPSERFKSAEEFRDALAKLEISAAAVAVPDDFNFFKTEGCPEHGGLKKRVSKALPIALCAAVICSLTVAAVVVSRSGSSPEVTEITLDSEYKGDFNIGGVIPSKELLKFAGDVEITIHVEPWAEMRSNDIHGVIPVNSGDHSVLEYLTAPGELWADENGWIKIGKGERELSLVISRKGIESLGNGGLGFETYNMIVTSAILRPAEEQNEILLQHSHKQRNAPYSVFDGEFGKNITAELGEFMVMDWGAHSSQSISKSAFYEFDGDVMVTITVEDVPEEIEENPYWRTVYVCNAGDCFDVIEKDILVAVIPAADDMANVSRVGDYGILFEQGCNECVLIVPERVKEKMTAGMFFNSVNVRVTSVRLAAYNGEFAKFI
ncbi:MAG: serine/threonine protein kinase, partial [Oscillospiraceae bacterium]|nr:serine/threonine protein kinase [Oscillospiraceae bacterium]